MNFEQSAKNRRIAFYGGSFDPLHNGHLTIARKITELFALNELVLIPAFHAPHKKDRQPTSAFHRYAMLCLATANESKLKVSTVELDTPEKPFTFETQARLKIELPDTDIYFVVGADSWAEITTWRDWETVLSQTNIIVVTRPDYEIEFSHVTKAIRARIVDLRGSRKKRVENLKIKIEDRKIFITDVVNLDVSATEIRNKIRGNQTNWQEFVPDEVAKYVEKYELYI